jgi:hypothetical protein
MRRSLLIGAIITILCLPAVPASAKSIGSCPPRGGWELASLADLGITEEQSAGIASLDGNRDGYTCIKPAEAAESSFVFGALFFRDNTAGL